MCVVAISWPGLAAQIGLALHFYHPLAHWLASRLRLEQELAADAWGARLSGGKPSYLATLAQMALRRDSRAMSWPARAFLPSHGTFVRRIEMLRNTKHIRPGSLPVAARVLTVGVLAALGLLVAGLRGPAGGSPVLAQDQPTSPDAQPTNRTTWPFCRLTRRWSWPFGPARYSTAAMSGRSSIPFDKGRCAAVRSSSLPRTSSSCSYSGQRKTRFRREATRRLSGLVLRMSKPQDWKAIAASAPRHPSNRRLVTMARPMLRTNPNGAKTGGIYMPDDRTLVVAEEALLRELIEDRTRQRRGIPGTRPGKRSPRGK